MHRDTEAALTRRVFRLIETGSTDSADTIYHLPIRNFVDLDYHQAELEGLFYPHPQAVGFSAEVASPGRFITRTIVGGLPVIVTRDERHQLHALVNVCRHRGARVVEASEGEARQLTCSFHAWCYGLDGSLTTIPDAESFDGLTKHDHALSSLPVEERHGLIWVQVPGARPMKVAQWLGSGLDEELSSYALAGYSLYRQQVFSLSANWKLAMDGFLESYHVRSLHRNSIGAYFYSNLSTVDEIGRHLRLVLPRRRIDRMFERPQEEWSLLDNAVVVYVSLPGVVFAWQSGHFDVFVMRPDKNHPGRCSVTLGMLIPDTRGDETDLWQRNWERTTATIATEDFAQAENIQAGFSAGIQDYLTIGRNELGMQRFYERIRTLVGA